MALNLSTLTSSATSGDVLQEVTTTADFLESVPVVRNLSRGSNKGGDAKQSVSLNQPRALPLDADGKGYLYVSGVSGNYASVPDATNLDGFDDFTFQVDNLYLPDWSPSAQVTPIAKGSSWQFSVHTSGSLRLDLSGVSSAFSDPTGLADKTTASIRAVRAGSVLTFFYSLNGGETWVSVPYNYGGGSGTLTNDPLPLAIGAANVSSTVLGKVSGAKVWNNATQSGTPVLDVDFTATTVRHGVTKFRCATNQIVTINTAGLDPAKIIKRPVLRFDGVNDGLNGLFSNNINGGYMFAAFSVLGNGGQSNGRVFGVSATGSADYQTNSAIFGYNANGALTAFNVAQHVGMFNDDNGDILLETKITNGSALSKVNNANAGTSSGFAIDSPHFNIATNAEVTNLSERTAIDLEFLALFSADSVPDEATASKIRNYINNRNNVFYRWDTDGYYFFDPQKATFTGNFTNFTGGNRLDGYITGSDNGDTDVRSNLTLIQETGNDQPSTDGYTITFHDNAEHLEFKNGVSQNLSGWQICGTSLGTFAYRVQGAVSELNLLGNAGAIRSIGDLYGIILLPASATGKDIEDARKLLIDRGAADSVSAGSVQQFWQSRNDIVEFKQVDTSSVTSFREGWRFCASLEIFPPLQAPNCTNFLNAWEGNSSLNSFGAIDASSGTTFTAAWKSCSSLQSFPAGAKLGTSASNVNFTSAWQSSGLTSFSTPLPTATNVSLAWLDCTSLTSFNVPLPLATNVNGTWYNCSSLTNFSSDLSSATNPSFAFYNCTSLSSFNTPLPLAVNMNGTWLNCSSLTDFSVSVFANWNPSSIASGIFNDAWDGCSALSATSVENILTSIDASGKYATSTGASGGTALGDAGIDIDYNVATGSLSAATNAAVTSLKAKGWSIIVNNVTL